MALTRSELEQLSVFYYLKEGLFSREYSQEVQGVPLVYDTEQYLNGVRSDFKLLDPYSAFGSLVPTRGRGLVSFEVVDPNPCSIFNETSGEYEPTHGTPFFTNSYSIPTERETNLIKVYDQAGNLMDRSWYEIDYDKGRIRFPAPSTPSGVVSSGLTPTTIDFRFHTIAMVNGWPGDKELPPLPIVSLYPTTEKSPEGIQIGPGVEFKRNYCIDVFATSTSMRRNIIDRVVGGLHNKHTSVIDFNRSGQPLKHWGVINPDFIQEVDYKGNTYRVYPTLNPGNGNILYFNNIEVFYDVSPRSTMSDSMRHMGKIKFSTCTYTDRDPGLVGKFNSLTAPPGGVDSLIKKGNTA